ncbi:beta-propeller fold lactonase family protein [Acidicapsa dinghuensis]|uniref:Beta-propeller fold lactonase family protein n=1 Tax=Acidicapsa dinghuensis TaxID=2218256 RepID=A0ABW1EH63_9BACT|nr:beta-propeller fold lactonase family protein [Acidicapsa dinghuensis]
MRFSTACFITLLALNAEALSGQTTQHIDLPTSKALIGEIPGHPQRINSLPMSMAVSPDGRYVVTINAGYGTRESNLEQSLSVLDTQTGTLSDFPDDRTLVNAKQTLYSGLAFSHDGKHIYASIGSISDPEGKGQDDTGSGIIVYNFNQGRVAPASLLHLPLEPLATGRKTKLNGDSESSEGIPFPAAIAVLGKPGAEKLLVADNLSDDVLILDAVSGKLEKRFDLSESDAVPGTYPIALAVTKDERRAFVALWNASEVVELDLTTGAVAHKLTLLKPESAVAPGTHPCALEITPDGRTMYVALANRDAVAAVNIGAGQFSVKGYFSTRLPGQNYFGAEPEALAISSDGSRLYVADAITDAVAVLDGKKLNGKEPEKFSEPIGFIPTEWMPMSMAVVSGKLYVATAKGHGTGPNNVPMEMTNRAGKRVTRKSTYIGTLLYGSLASIDTADIDQNLRNWTSVVLESNRMKSAQQQITFADGSQSHIKHVIYIIKENRTYDQILGDLEQNGHPVGNGDSKLTMYGESITPNQHKLVLQFGVLDNFYDSGEVSGDGHVWSTAGIGTDYLEKTWQQSYRGGQRTYDYEGVVANGTPLLEKIPDVNEPRSGYLWGDLATHGKTYYHFGEFIATVFCTDVKKAATLNPQQGPMLAGENCARPEIKPGEEIPANWGGGVNKWPWAIPLIATNTPTKPELVGHFAPEAPDFDLMIPDQIRVNIFEHHLKQWVADRVQGKDTMPNFVLLRLGDDHTAGTRPGSPTPRASVADNDLAVGRAVEDISHSPFWDDTAFFILEDDAQDGGDHVEAHRSTVYVISKYAPHGPNSGAFVDSHFYTTVSVLHTMEALLGVPPMNNNDALSPVIASLFTGPGDQPPYEADRSNDTNGLIYTANPKNAPGAQASMKMDFRHADHADAQKLNVILWRDAMGNAPVPAQLLQRHKQRHDDDDD